MKLLAQCVFGNLLGALGAYLCIDYLLHEIVLGNLGMKQVQKFIHGLPLRKRLCSGVLRVKVTRYQREFDLYVVVRRGVMITLAVVMAAQIILIALGQEKPAEMLISVSLGAVLITMLTLDIHAEAWNHRTKYTRKKA